MPDDAWIRDFKRPSHDARQVMKCADAGADIVRITVQGKREALACKKIRELLNEKVQQPRHSVRQVAACVATEKMG